MTILDLEKKERAERKLAEIATAMLDGSLPYSEGAGLIVSASLDADLDRDRDPDILPFIAITSEVDRFPAPHTRHLWNREALAKMQPEIDQMEAWVKEFAEPFARNLLTRFAGVKRPPWSEF